MKRILPLFLSFLLTTSLSAQLQSASANSASPSDVSAPQGGSPIVIRSSDPATSKTTDTPAPKISTPPTTPGSAARAPGSGSPKEGDTSGSPSENDFQEFVESAVGRTLPIFGSQLFFASSSFAANTSAVPSADYVLGAGDQLVIRSSGKVDMDVHATVDRNGQIFIPRVGMLTVAGLRLDNATGFIHDAIAKQFTGFELSVSLSELRSIQIYVLGNAKSPGAFNVSALSTLVNALFASGGPSSSGTLRDIQLKRDGKIITHFDVYRLLLAGDKSADVRLLPGDVIFIPALGPQVAIDGDVSTPAIYEIIPGETVGTALNYAGGLTPVADKSRAVLEHVIDHSRRSIEELPLSGKSLDIRLQTADVLRVFPVSPKISDAVTLRGNVATPGRYAWHPGMRVSDLIPNREFLLTRTYYNHQNSLDVTTGSQPFKESKEAGIPTAAVHDTEINWNYAVIQRLGPEDLTTQLVSFRLGEAIANPSSPENKTLQPGDVLVIYSVTDAALPLELQAKFIRIDGQVNAPGTYRVQGDETLRDLVQRAGGLAPHAYLYASVLTRESVATARAADLKKLIERESQAILSPSNQRISLNGGGTSATADLELRRAYVAQLETIKPDGRVVLSIAAGAVSLADIPAVPLEDADHFFVPSVPSTIDILGAVFNPVALAFTPKTHAETYLRMAGGAMREADAKREFIVRGNGTVLNRENTRDFKHQIMNPGDALVVPAKLRASNGPISLTDLSTILTTFALTAITLRSVN